MIYTCTLNPSLDYFMTIDDEVKANYTNRTCDEYYQAGGKGVNVSIALNNLMIPTKCVGFLGGFNYDFYIRNLETYTYLQPGFVKIKDNTRINLKISAIDGEYNFNASGPNITQGEIDLFVRRMGRLNPSDYFVLSGNIQPELVEMVTDGIKDLHETGVKLVFDTDVELERKLLKYEPLLVKPNLDELSSLVGRTIESVEDIYQAGKELLDDGAKNVIVSKGSEGSWLMFEDKMYYCKSLDGELKNVVGCGDAMIAGYLFNVQRGGNSLDAFRFANACSNATAFSRSFGTKEEVLSLLDKIEIEEIK